MNDFSIDGKKFYEFLEALAENQKISTIKFTGYGLSMTPFIRSGNRLTIKIINEDSRIYTGDIVAVKQRDKKRIVVHRVIDSNKDKYLIKGDNNRLPDGWFQKDLIIGTIIKIQRHLGKTYYPKKWYGLIIAFLSKTLILNTILLPAARYLKKSMTGVLGR